MGIANGFGESGARDTGPSETGRFWLCPECKRHVPSRRDACLCGFDRTTVPVRMREVTSRPASNTPPERSFISVVWPYVVIAGLLGFITYQNVGSPQPVPTPEHSAMTSTVPSSTAELTDSVAPTPVLYIRDAPAREVVDLPTPDPTAPPPQVIRIEVPAQTANQPLAAPATVPSGPSEDELRAEEDRRREVQWQMDTSRIISQLRASMAAYRAQLCNELRSGIPISNTRDTRTEYLAARFAAVAHEENARIAGARPGWVRIPWSEFPEPEDAAGSATRSDAARVWRCN